MGMSSQMTKDTINLVHKLDDIPKKDFKYILPKELSVSTKIISHCYSLYIENANIVLL